MRLRQQSGDTIVEVLIVIIVVGTILAGAFVTVNKSIANVRQAQERVEAVKVAESQLESLKSVAKDIAKPLPVSGYFCLSSSNYVTEFDSATYPARAADPLTGYNSACADASNNSRYLVAIEPKYQGLDNTYLVHVRWERINGGSIEEVTMAYKAF